ncbi:DUF523 domain-containing protein [Psychrosphaera sp. B3R10]|uniref:DUF523 domain-containing protein n=1 Tax=Psychrosphaera algicola TaxID=3023714 RepID=A0ABT5FFE9_9GAMM|nr:MULTISPECIES: DUF523 domain-containing protein [unclassified Psychrosphaera]MBU2883182.1 DUF523 domain-containing protein [Psychrosphaera sp. I2R16]MBU2988638.1 DUF523 domain-containing protein [Psychrosphaera sp. B3R10]MDC2890280.1 DUF523 domain-containing protein [Psychrosphaera sp. G1-22]
MYKTNNFKLLVSACLLGHPVRYDGKSKPLADLSWLKQLQQDGKLVVMCPEVMGGLNTPRAPAEYAEGKVITVQGIDVTEAFEKGADQALALCQAHQVSHALLKANSPSCGNQQIYDGTFSATLIDGEGVTARRLRENGVAVFSELQLNELQQQLNHSD